MLGNVTPMPTGTQVTGQRTYVLVTPVRNEEATIGITAESVVQQTLRPAEWVIVSDGSTDGTDQIVRNFAAKHGWIKLHRLAEIATRSFASVVRATCDGIRCLAAKEYSYLGLLDGDVRFDADFFERLIAKFEAEPRLGIGGGLVLDPGMRMNGIMGLNLAEVAGATHFFRRTCFESLEELIPIPEGGWDTVTCIQARMNGFTTRTFPQAQGGPLEAPECRRRELGSTLLAIWGARLRRGQSPRL